MNTGGVLNKSPAGAKHSSPALQTLIKANNDVNSAKVPARSLWQRWASQYLRFGVYPTERGHLTTGGKNTKKHTLIT